MNPTEKTFPPSIIISSTIFSPSSRGCPAAIISPPLIRIEPLESIPSPSFPNPELIKIFPPFIIQKYLPLTFIPSSWAEIFKIPPLMNKNF